MIIIVTISHFSYVFKITNLYILVKSLVPNWGGDNWVMGLSMWGLFIFYYCISRNLSYRA